MKATRTRHGWVHIFITHRPTLTLRLHNFDLFRTCRTSSFCTVAWQLARFPLTRRIARSLGDSWAFCSSRRKVDSEVAAATWVQVGSVLQVVIVRRSAAARAYSKRVPRTNCALRIKKCAPRISSGIYFLSTRWLTNNVVFNLSALICCYFG